MKREILAFVASGMLLLAVIVGCSGSDGPAKKSKSTKRGYVLITKTGSEMGPVEFFHRKHKKFAMNEEKCKTCHHVGRWGQSCGEPGCHNDPEKDEGAARIHMTCLERCHAANPAKSPTDCSDPRCHQSME
jgi:hypothetical protein